ncbi:TAXI family TRAP transporter solute-binding subunit [Aeromonas cavernicola]|uniref:C4-dicarboxylate ABC transporter substrate-binding protein n=1 Tax=Aeromonas cavernicola TaxID=1006623 RepID=A0A2H9U185_9GAMM|nr:TAXI family TRAP transporter solute-binding subunit [Aeromonas cavernicola]PJG57812.1 C4-dicarboxylate ABC transporter substrate-binding protein [Aeromonas cavernicola]
MNKKWMFFSICLVLSLSTRVALATPASIQMTIGTGAVTGIYYPVGGAICQLINNEQIGQKCAVESTGGSVENLMLLEKKELQLALVQSDVLQQALSGSGVFSDKPVNDIYPILSLYSEPLNIVVAGDTDIYTIDDLKGKRIDIGNKGSGDRDAVDKIMNVLNWGEDAFSEKTELKAAERSEALCSGKIDAFFIVAGHPNQIIREAVAQCNARLVAISQDVIDEFIKKNPSYIKQSIPASTYRLRDEPVATVGITAMLVTHKGVDNSFVVKLKNTLSTHLEKFRLMHPVLAQLDWKLMSSFDSE